MSDNTCFECGRGTLRPERRTIAYDWSGLDGVELVGVPVHLCDICGEYEVQIPAFDELHALLAEKLLALARRLNPQEIRFLRKHLGWGSSDFAREAGVTLETVSRWESGARQPSKSHDRLIRLLVAYHAPIEDYRRQDEAAPEEHAEAPLRLERSDDHWTAAAA